MKKFRVHSIDFEENGSVWISREFIDPDQHFDNRDQEPIRRYKSVTNSSHARLSRRLISYTATKPEWPYRVGSYTRFNLYYKDEIT